MFYVFCNFHGALSFVFGKFFLYKCSFVFFRFVYIEKKESDEFFRFLWVDELELEHGSVFVQEFQSEKAMEAMEKMVAPEARVLRDGKEVFVPAREVVPGDIIILETICTTKISVKEIRIFSFL